MRIQEIFHGFYKKNKSQLIRNISNELKSKIKSYIEKYTYNKPLKECKVWHNNIKDVFFFLVGIDVFVIIVQWLLLL